MKLAVAASLCALACAGGQAAPVEDDDWELVEDPAQEMTLAAVRYDGGQSILAQCQRGRLVLLLTGLPESEEMVLVAATRADGRATTQRWTPVVGPGTYRSVTPGREARFLRGGGAYVVRSAVGAATAINATFDLPGQSANLDRVLTACGWALEDDRDLLEEADVTIAPRSSRRPPPPFRVPSVPEREVSCVVRETRFRECRADHPPSANTSNTRSLIRAVQGEIAHVPIGADPASAEGKVFRVIASNQLLIMVRR